MILHVSQIPPEERRLPVFGSLVEEIEASLYCRRDGCIRPRRSRRRRRQSVDMSRPLGSSYAALR